MFDTGQSSLRRVKLTEGLITSMVGVKMRVAATDLDGERP